MNRRTVLHTLGSGAVVGSAGCATRIDGASDETHEPSSSASTDATTTANSDALPFRDSGGERTLSPGVASFVNESTDSKRVTFWISHDGEELFTETYELGAGFEERSPGLVAAQGEYDIRVTTDSGEETTDVWRVRGWWPKYEVRVTEAGELLAGCKPGESSVSVENLDSESRTLALAAFDRDTDELVGEQSVELGAGAEESVEDIVRIGGDYTLRATVDDGDERDEAGWVVCYCYGDMVDVRVRDSVPEIEVIRTVCE